MIKQLLTLMASYPLQGKLEEIKQLKTEYGIGSLDAWRYLKSQEFYTALRDDIVNALYATNLTYRPTLRELSNLCQYVQFEVQWAFRAWSYERASETRGKHPQLQDILFCNPQVNQYHDSDMNLQKTAQRTWMFDYQSFLIHYCQLKDVCRDMNDQDLFVKVFASALTSTHPYLTDDKGNRLTFSQVRKTDSLLITDSDAGRTKKQRPKQFERAIWQSVINDFHFLYGNKDKLTAEDQFEIGEGMHESEEAAISIRNRITHEEHLFLYKLYTSDDSYKRAQRERTLGRIEIERRIALQEVLANEYIGGNIFGSSYQEKIEGALDVLKAHLSEIREKLKNQKLWSSDEVYSDVGFLGELEGESKYKLAALKKNRKWLEKVLSN